MSRINEEVVDAPAISHLPREERACQLGSVLGKPQVAVALGHHVACVCSILAVLVEQPE